MAKVVVVWMKSGLRDLQAIYDFIALDNPEAAAQLIDQILATSRSLGQFPQVGLALDGYKRPGHFQVLVRKSYRIIYKIAGSKVSVRRVLRTSQDLTAAE